MLNRPEQQPASHGDDRQRATRAREAAEALFKPKRQAPEQSVAEQSVAAPPPADQLAPRKPRVLATSSPAPHDEHEAPASPAPPAMLAISRSQFARIRAWAQYGMTIPQVAEAYGVTVGEIERILQG